MATETINYGLKKPDENEYYSVPIFNQNADIMDTELKKAQNHRENFFAHITQLSCTKAGTVYALTGLTATDGKVLVVFQADAAYVAGDTFTVDGTAYTVQTSNGVALAAGAFATGAILLAALDIDNHKINIKSDAPEVGTWNPILKVNGVEHATTTKAGWYIKFGKTVIIGCKFNIPAPLGSGAVDILGLPWVAAVNHCEVINITDSATTNFALMNLIFDSSSFRLYKVQQVMSAFDAASVTGSQPQIDFQFTYQTW